jgi:hypothetical protein
MRVSTLDYLISVQSEIMVHRAKHSTTIETEMQIDIEMINDEKADMVQIVKSIATFFELDFFFE